MRCWTVLAAISLMGCFEKRAPRSANDVEDVDLHLVRDAAVHYAKLDPVAPKHGRLVYIPKVTPERELSEEDHRRLRNVMSYSRWHNK